MADETITVAEVSDGPGGTGDPGVTVTLPVVEMLTGRGFITGKSGSGKSNTASVVVEKLLEAGYGLLIVDIDGEYYGLKEEYEILHVGADEECDIQVGPQHAEKIAQLALEKHVPIILDVSSFLDETKANELLTEVARHLFAKEKKVKQPFLLLVEEVHEYIPEGGGMDECGRMLIKIGKRGRKHGLGIVGISQRPADVKKDFITQCDWLVWHRLTWKNDTKVVSRVIDPEYADAVEDLGDGEGFLMTDWTESIRRVQFYRKQTFDAGATPGLDDFERPDLKSVSEDLVAEISEISDEKEAKEDRVEELREELDRKNSRIAELEAELKDARDMRRMADQFTEALLQQTEGTNPGKTAVEETQERRERREANVEYADTADREESPAVMTGGTAAADGAGAKAATNGHAEQESAADGPQPNGDSPDGGESLFADTDAGFGFPGDEAANGTDASRTDTGGQAATDGPDVPDQVERLRAKVVGMERTTRAMLRYYREQGPGAPLDAHFAAGGSGDRTHAYARNRTLRLADLVEHVGRGNYDYRLPEAVAAACEESLDDDTQEEYVEYVEHALD